MRAVWKYPLVLHFATQVIEMPEEAEVIHVAEQNGAPTLWALVETERRTTERRFFTRATGQEVWTQGIDAFVHVGTLFSGPFVWHVFEDTTK